MKRFIAIKKIIANQILSPQTIMHLPTTNAQDLGTAFNSGNSEVNAPIISLVGHC